MSWWRRYLRPRPTNRSNAFGGLAPGARTGDPGTFAVLIPLLTAAAAFASVLPARRASSLDPLAALRQE